MEANEKDTCHMQDAEAVVKDCNNNLQYRHYLTKWPDTTIELLESQLARSFQNVKDECQLWTAEKMYEFIANHSKQYHQESCWRKTRIDKDKIKAIERANEGRNKQMVFSHLPKDAHSHYTYTSQYEWNKDTHVLTIVDLMRLYACLLTTTSLITAHRPRATIPACL